MLFSYSAYTSITDLDTDNTAGASKGTQVGAVLWPAGNDNTQAGDLPLRSIYAFAMRTKRGSFVLVEKAS